MNGGVPGLATEDLLQLPVLADYSVIRVETTSPLGVRVLLLAFGVPDSRAGKARPILESLEENLRIRLENLRLSEAMARHSAMLADLHRSVSGLSRRLLNVSDLLQTISQEAQRLIGVDTAAILLSSGSETPALSLKAHSGAPPAASSHLDSLFARAILDYRQSGRKIHLEAGEFGEKLLLIPIALRGEPEGLLFFSSSSESFYYREDLLQMAELFGDWIAIAFENAVMFDRVSSSQREWENTFDSISDPIYLIDSNYRLMKINKSLAAYAMLSIKLPREQVCYSVLFHRDSICPWCPVTRSLQTGAPVMVETPLFNGGIWQIQSYPFTDKAENRVGSINVLRDITLLKRMQEQLIESEKLASTGKLISGVAHEVRNPLFGISTTARALANELGNKEELRPFLDIITSETTRLNRLMEELLNYSRPVKIDKNPSDLGEIIREVMGKFQKDPEGKAITINLFGTENIPPINVDRNKMHQVLLNLFENSIQHSGNQPRIDVFLEFLALSYPPEIQIVVKDHGSGIKPEVLARIFDPFFTTRSRGTGLGLSIVRKVVHDHGGRIAVESHPGMGTTFRISVPVHIVQA